jgi:hypothetical protein
MAPAGKPSRMAAAMAAAASVWASVAGELLRRDAWVSSESRRPLATMRKPKPARRSVSRLPSQELWVVRGGLVSQYPVKAKRLRRLGRAASPG